MSDRKNAIATGRAGGVEVLSRDPPSRYTVDVFENFLQCMTLVAFCRILEGGNAIARDRQSGLGHLQLLQINNACNAPQPAGLWARVSGSFSTGEPHRRTKISVIQRIACTE